MPRFIQPALLGLLLLLALKASAKEENPDSVKGAIWTHTARLVWKAQKLRLPPIPIQQWNSPHNAENWLERNDPNDDSGMRDLLQKVRSAVPKQKNVANPTPSKLVSTIVDLIHRDRAKLENVNWREVNTDLQKLLHSTTSTPASPKNSADQAAKADTSHGQGVESSTTSTVDEKLDNASEITALKQQQATLLEEVAQLKKDAGRNWLLTALIALTSAVFGLVAGWWLRGRWDAQDSIELKQEVRRLKQELRAEKNQAFQIKPVSPATPTTKLSTALPPPVEPSPSEAPVLLEVPVTREAPATPVAGPQVLFAALREGAFIEDSQLKTEPSPHYALKITISARDPKKARFELNPAANQQSLIEYRLELLREYFTFTLPTGKPSTLTNREQGRFVRETDGWRVNTNHKGQLDVH